MKKNDRIKDLRILAKLYQIETTYCDPFQKNKIVSNESLIAFLRAMHVDIANIEDSTALLKIARQHLLNKILDEVIVNWQGEVCYIPLNISKKLQNTGEWHLTLENGTAYAYKLPHSTFVEKKISMSKSQYCIKLPMLLPCGYHHFTIEIGNQRATCLIITAPKTGYVPSHEKTFGFFAPMYSLQSKDQQLCGDLKLFSEFMQWAGSQGAGFLSTLPINALYLDDPYLPSPYSPISKLYWNEIYLDCQKIPEFNKEDAHALKREDPGDEVDFKLVYQQKRKILQAMSDRFFTSDRHACIEEYLNTHADLMHYAQFRADGEKNNGYANNSNLQYHLYTQWQFDLQLTDLYQHAQQQNVLFYLDLPLSVYKNGYDNKRFANQFVSKITLGAPPDPIFHLGQNWDLAAGHPLGMKVAHYEYFIKTIDTIMRYIDLLRLDHVMGLHRLFWIPEGGGAEDGTYIHYQADALYAILLLESHRKKVGLIGENLGNVPHFVNQAMREHRLYQMYVLQYELDSNHPLRFEKIPEKSVCSLNTHDMAPFASYWQGKELQTFKELALIDDEDLKKRQAFRRKNVKHLLRFIKGKHQSLSIEDVFKSIITQLAQSSSQFLLLNIEDLWLEEKQQNIPTIANKSFRNKLRYTLEEIANNNVIKSIAEKMRQIRPASPPPAPKKGMVIPYSLLSEDDIYLFNEGNHFRLYEKLGAHIQNVDGKAGIYFAVWAPNAKSVSVIGDFNGWEHGKHILFPHGTSGIWEGFIPNIDNGSLYKYFIRSHQFDYEIEKSDPFGFNFEIAPKTAAIVNDLNYEWHDKNWLDSRKDHQRLDSPISIYELHLGSWRRMPEENNRFLTYREIAPYLASYANEMGYTHVEFMPIMEHPYAASWGYQMTGYFAPTSRFGSPQDFMYLIDYLHEHNIGVILDWVPSHFPMDKHGLAYFDGTYLYEHTDPRKGYHPDWTSAIFNYSRHEVQAILISSANFWFDRYHIDGLRVDAVASMLYLDYSRKPNEWIPNQYGGRENLEAIHFLQKLNSVVYQNYPGIQTFAEESTAWTNVTKPPYVGGLGFGFKWDMGWMHDTLRYFSHDPIYRKYHHNDLTFRLLYAFTENFVLSLSHDEVVHGKKSLLNRMPGDVNEKFANLRLLFGYQFAQPGKKLLFMGDDFGQWDEWNHDKSLDWHLTEYLPHQQLQAWVKLLNHLYYNESALNELDNDPRGFAWINCEDHQQSVIAFMRKNAANNAYFVIILNATPIARENYLVGVPNAGNFYLKANSDNDLYGGTGHILPETIISDQLPWNNYAYSICLNLPPLSILFYKWVAE